MSTNHSSARGTLSLAISLLALVVALSGTAYAALGAGSVGTKQLAKAAVTKGKIKNGAVTAKKIRAGGVGSAALAPGAVGGGTVADGSLTGADLAADSVGSDVVTDRTLRLHDLGGGAVTQTVTTGTAISIAAGGCASVRTAALNPAPNGLLGSMVVGTITNSSGGAVVSNSGFVLPTLVTETSQGGAAIHLGVCAGSAAQTIPVGSIVTYSVIAP
jgi:hypothetical protein